MSLRIRATMTTHEKQCYILLLQGNQVERVSPQQTIQIYNKTKLVGCPTLFLDKLNQSSIILVDSNA